MFLNATHVITTLMFTVNVSDVHQGPLTEGKLLSWEPLTPTRRTLPTVCTPGWSRCLIETGFCHSHGSVFWITPLSSHPACRCDRIDLTLWLMSWELGRPTGDPNPNNVLQAPHDRQDAPHFHARLRGWLVSRPPRPMKIKETVF